MTDSLLKHGIEMYRFKTGTPARIDGKTIDYSKMTRQDGDVPVVPFSFETDPATVQIDQVPVYLTHTNEETHAILRIIWTVPRSIPERSPEPDHVIVLRLRIRLCVFPKRLPIRFLLSLREGIRMKCDIDGMSSSMPEDVQDTDVPDRSRAGACQNCQDGICH